MDNHKPRIWKTLCEYGNHIVNMHPATLYVYTDEKNGIKRDTQTCPRCYVDHIRKYYPDNKRIIDHVKGLHPEVDWTELEYQPVTSLGG